MATTSPTLTLRGGEFLLRHTEPSGVFTPEQRAWMDLICEHIATNVTIEADDFDRSPFNQRGGLGKVHELFGDQLTQVLDEFNEALAS